MSDPILSDPSDPQRVAFETWAQDGAKFGCDRDEAGEYVEADTREAWAAFQARGQA